MTILKAGAVLAGRYRLEARIATGAEAEVWRAADLTMRRPAAIKFLREQFARSPACLARFQAETRHAGSLSHPGIVQVYGYHDARPQLPPYLVMDLAAGPSLAEMLSGGPLGAAAAMGITASAAAGLAAVHGAGLVHRDIKPGNLLLAGGRVNITGFGLACPAGPAVLPPAGRLAGAPAYLAPERAAGWPATPASDLYSLGVVAYECLAGQPPFQGTPLRVAAAHQRLPLPPLPARVPAPVAALVARLSAKDPLARPPRAAEAARQAGQLRDALSGRATVVLTRPPRRRPATFTDTGRSTLLTGRRATDPRTGHRPRRHR